jgi:protein phosphatase
MRSHVGLVREGNEDSVAFIVPGHDDRAAMRGSLAIIADGMGGHAAGEVASRIAVDTVCAMFYAIADSIPDSLAKCLRAANAAVRDHAAAHPRCAGMGTTCTVVVIKDDRLFLGQVGDSRAYLLRRGKLQQISEDQSLVADLVREGRISAAAARTHPDRNIITTALGVEPTVGAKIWPDGKLLEDGDVVVLCSDGLSDMVDDERIEEIVSRRAPAEACDALIDAALRAGGHDNISVGVFALDIAA